jgi:hypothetical protein
MLSARGGHPFPKWEWTVTKKSSEWREALKAASREASRDRQRSLCEEARQIMQQRLVEIADRKGRHKEERSIEEGLREIWALEQKIDRRFTTVREKSNRPPQK